MPFFESLLTAFVFCVFLLLAGYVKTIAGTVAASWNDGLAADSQFNSPSGLAVTPDNTIIVSDSANHVLRKIMPCVSLFLFFALSCIALLCFPFCLVCIVQNVSAVYFINQSSLVVSWNYKNWSCHASLKPAILQYSNVSASALLNNDASIVTIHCANGSPCNITVPKLTDSCYYLRVSTTFECSSCWSDCITAVVQTDQTDVWPGLLLPF
jgi:hypothetical protein